MGFTNQRFQGALAVYARVSTDHPCGLPVHPLQAPKYIPLYKLLNLTNDPDISGIHLLKMEELVLSCTSTDHPGIALHPLHNPNLPTPL
jgi:hypothetical protein